MLTQILKSSVILILCKIFARQFLNFLTDSYIHDFYCEILWDLIFSHSQFKLTELNLVLKVKMKNSFLIDLKRRFKQLC